MSIIHPPSTSETLADLATTIRTLWAAEPQIGADDRQSAVAQLLALKADVERLSLRQACGTLRPEDIGEIRNCADRLARVERQWNGISLVPAAAGGGASAITELAA